MMLATRVTFTMIGVILLTAALGSLAYRRLDAAILLEAFAVVIGILVLAMLVVQLLTPLSFRMTAAVPADTNAMVPISGAGKAVLASAFQQLEHLYQYTAAEATGSNVETVIPSDRLKEHRAVLSKALKEESIEDCETTRLAKDGRRIDVSHSIRPVKSCAEKIVGIAAITRDIPAEKFADEKFRLAVESCPNGMIMIDRAGKILLVNGEIERLFGYGRIELIGQSVDLLIPESLRPQDIRQRNGFAHDPEASGMGAIRDSFGRRKDGSEFPVEVGFNPLHTREGLLALGVIVDISERKRIERMKDEFVATVSHELRTPLTSISASLALLAGTADVKLSEATKRLITIAHSNSQRLVRLINDILDVEKIESGKVVFKLQRVEVRSLIGQAVEASRPLAHGYGVRLRFDGASLHEVRADPDRLMQVVANLLSNAIKFSPSDAEVIVEIENHGQRVRITVRDHGPGIPEDFRLRIFDKFAQADASDERQKGGTGLGLSIVKQIVLRLGGEVGFNNVLGGGAIFYVELPRLDTVEDDDAERAERFNGARILLCEDDSDAAAVIRDRLRGAGFATDHSQTVAGALTKANTTAYSAILVDPQLPDGDGISLIQRLRAQPQYGDTPIIVVSANPGRGREDLRSPSLDVLDWLSKPLDLARLLRTVRPAMARNGGALLRVLHFDDDPEALGIVAQALNNGAQVVSVATVEQARRALAASQFDLAVIDLALHSRAGLDLLPELHDGTGEAIPVIVYSAQGANPLWAAQVQDALTRSRASIDSLIAILRKRVAISYPHAPKERESA